MSGPMSTKTLKIISADDRLAEKGGPKLLLIGPSGVGKTSTLHTLSAKLLASTLAFDIEAGLIAVSDLQFASVRPRTWDDCRNLACVLGGPNPALPATATYSEAHFNELMKDDELARLTSYTTLFIDSLTGAGRLCFTWAEQQPEAFTDRGRKDLRAVYGLHARSMTGWLNQLQHARERTVIFTAVLEKNTRAFVCTNPNQWGYPAKDRSGRLEQIEPPNLGALIEKLTGPGQRKPFTVVSPEQHAQN